MRQRDQEYIKTIPDNRQLMHQKLEFYAFFHFTVNTFTGKEWGGKGLYFTADGMKWEIKKKYLKGVE